MIQHKKLERYCLKMLLKHSIEDNSLLKLDNKTYEIVDDSQKLFDEDFKFLPISEKDIDGYVYMFGGRWYVQNVEDEEGTLTELKYIGEPNQKLPTNHFLGIHSGNELLNGVGMYSDWIKKALFLGVKTLGICEKSSLAGVMSFQTLCKSADIKPIIGMTVPVKNDFQNYEIKAYAENFDGWQNLLKFSEKLNVFGNVNIEENFIESNCDGLTLIIDPKTTEFENRPNFIELYQLDTVRFEQEDKDIDFINNFEKFLTSELSPIAVQDAYYIEQNDWEVREKLWGVAKSFHYQTKNQYFKNTDQFASELISMFKKGNTSFIKLFKESISNLDSLVERCNFEYDTTSRHLPKYEMTEEESLKFKNNEELFMHLVKKGFKERGIKDAEKYVDRLKTEIKVLKDGDVIDYFLTTRSIIEDAKQKEILVGLGRGSAGGCLVSYLLGIIEIDPMDFDLLFERFLNPGRIGEFKDCEAYSIETDEGKITLNEGSIIKILREGKEKNIFVESLIEGDEIIKY